MWELCIFGCGQLLSLVQIEKLLDERAEDDEQKILLATKSKIESMKVS
jgi:hypothetical protein